MKERVFLTGTGLCCPIGTGSAEVFDSIAKGTYGTGELSVFDATGFPSRFAAEARSQGAVVQCPPGADRKAVLLQKAFEDLVQQCGPLDSRSPFAIATGIDHFDFPSYAAQAAQDPEAWRFHNVHACQVAYDMAKQFGLQGETQINVAACVASTQSMGLAFRMVRKGLHSTVITGGFDSMLSHLHYMGFHKLGALSAWQGAAQHACRPFDKDRSGIVLGEGAALFRFQNEATAQPEQIVGEMLGYGSSMDAYLVTDPEPEGKLLAQAIWDALAEAGLQASDIDCVHLHGTGTFKNDLAETAAMKLVFGNNYTQVPVFSLKGQIGHLIGACGAVETAGVLYSLLRQEVPITVNSDTPDPDVPLLVARQASIRKPIRHVLKLNAAFGGQNTALIFKRYERVSP